MENQVLLGRYRLTRQLGKGGMGSVWLAEHLTLSSWVAIKLMDPSIASTQEGAERFKREAQAAASLRSAHVVQVLDYGVHEDTPFLVMELLQGQSLAECLERELRLAPERALAIVTQVARAIGRAHAAGIVHRDLKPDNIYLVREDDQELAKVLDFGIAKTSGTPFGGMETRTGVTMGTPYYMSPEQVEGKKALDHRSDLWSLTVIACECLTGTRPFDGETYGELLLNICARPIQPPSRLGFYLPGFDEWFAKGTSRDPEQRFASAQELSASLADVVAGRARPAPLGIPQTTGNDRTVPMDPALLSFTAPGVNQAVQPITAPQAFGIAPHPGHASTHSPQRSSLFLALALLAFAVLALVVVLVLVLRKPDEVPLPTAAGTVGAASAPTPAPVVLDPEPTVAPGPTPTATPTVKPAPQAAPVNKAPQPATLPVPALPAAPAQRASRCYSDPFTGQLRVAGAGQSGSFPCKQNPFTGAWQRQ